LAGLQKTIRRKSNTTRVVPRMKTCTCCGIEKPLDDFYKDSYAKDKKCYRCKDCIKASLEGKNLYKKGSHFKRKYGLSVEDFNKMEEEQGGRCLICRARKSLVVDHCHKTMKVRGLLCLNCNTSIGNFYDNIGYIYSAAEYLLR
jgi:hypothetical protein